MTESASSVKVLGFGSALLDVLARVDEEFIPEFAGGEKGGMVMTDADSLDRMIRHASGRDTAPGPPARAIGGSACNTLFGLAHLGMKTSLLAKVGNDEEGAYYKASYRSIGGDLSAFKTHPQMRTGRCLSLITPDSERTMRTDLAAASTLEPDEITEDDFRGITHLHVEGYMLFNFPVFERVMKLAKTAQCTVSLDLASFEIVRIFRERLPGILGEYVDLLFANEDEAREFCGMREEDFDPAAAADRLAEYCPTVCVKLGSAGALIRSAGPVYTEVAAEKANAVDTTGAGDLWQAGFLYGYLNGFPHEISGKMASATGAEVVQVIGAALPPERWEVLRGKFRSLESNSNRKGS